MAHSMWDRVSNTPTYSIMYFEGDYPFPLVPEVTPLEKPTVDECGFPLGENLDWEKYQPEINGGYISVRPTSTDFQTPIPFVK